MNRHSRFYADLNSGVYDDEGYDEESDYGEEEEYYEESGCEEAYMEAEEPEVKVVNPFTTVTPEADADFEVLLALVPALDSVWEAQKLGGGIPLLEKEAIEALRASEYNPEDAAQFIQVQRASKKAAARSIKVAGTVRESAKEQPADVHVDPTEASSPSRSVASFSSPSTASPVGGRESNACTLIITGHVDAGKSTLLGHMLLLLEEVPASPLVRAGSSCQYAWILDQSEEERRRGVTIDSGTFSFQTDHRRIHVLDAPGHSEYLLNMVSSATQADVALLLLPATEGEFEVSLSHGTRNHLIVLRTLGVEHIIVAVNKMDVVQYSEERFHYVVEQLKVLLKELQIGESQIVGCCPVSGRDGTNLVALSDNTPWYTGEPLVTLIDTCPLRWRSVEAPLRITVQDVQPNLLYVKVESGRLKRGTALSFFPNNIQVTAKTIIKASCRSNVADAIAGEQIEIIPRTTVTGLYPGSVGCDKKNLIKPSEEFEAYIQTFESLPAPLLPGTWFTLVAHALTVPVKVTALLAKYNPDGSVGRGMTKCIPASSSGKIRFRTETKVALEAEDFCPALRRFVLSQSGAVVAGGFVELVRATS